MSAPAQTAHDTRCIEVRAARYMCVCRNVRNKNEMNLPALFAADNVYRFDSVGVSSISFVSVGADKSLSVVAIESTLFVVVVGAPCAVLLGNFDVVVDDEVDTFVGVNFIAVVVVVVVCFVGFVFAAVDDEAAVDVYFVVVNVVAGRGGFV